MAPCTACACGPSCKSVDLCVEDFPVRSRPRRTRSRHRSGSTASCAADAEPHWATAAALAAIVAGLEAESADPGKPGEGNLYTTGEPLPSNLAEGIAAARADRHYLISKDALEKGKRVATRVTEVAAERRREEIARMLAGAEITAEARAAAERLIKAAS